MKIVIDRIDHIVFTVFDIEKTIAVYTQVLGMKEEIFDKNRKALVFGNQKFNLHQKGKEFVPKAKMPIPGAIDICLISKTQLDNLISSLIKYGIRLEDGPVERIDAIGKIKSVYIRDPDQNLIEISNYF